MNSRIITLVLLVIIFSLIASLNYERKRNTNKMKEVELKLIALDQRMDLINERNRTFNYYVETLIKEKTNERN